MNINTVKIPGPFGNYDHGTPGAVLNAAVRYENVPLHKVERFQVGDGVITDGVNIIARYKWFDGLDHPCFYWLGEYRRYSEFRMQDRDGKQVPKFRATLTCHGTVGLEVNKELAVPALYQFINKTKSSHSNKEGHSVYESCGAMCHGGCHDNDGRRILLEFWKPEGVQAFVDYLNENYDPEAEVFQF